MLLQSEFPPDIRLEKEIRSLSQNGFRVILLCNQFNKENNKSFLNCEIHRIKALSNSKKVNKILNFPIFFNPRFIIKGILLCKKYSPDFIHAHDLPMAPLGILLGKFLNKKVIYDMHENYPQALRFFEKKGIINFLFKNYRLALLLDRICIKRVDRIIVVVQENKERLIALSVDPQIIYLVSNTIDIDSYSNFLPNQEIKKIYEANNVILYTGSVSPDRGLDTPIKAMKFITQKVSNVKLLIVGEGPNIGALKNLAKKNGVNHVIEFISWPGHEQLVTYWDLADICIVPQPSNDFIDTTIPHKLFEYMFFEKPVLVSDAKPLKRIVEETNCGLVFTSKDPLDFAEKVIELLNSNNIFGINGKKSVTDKYNWNKDAEKLIDLYNGLSIS